MLRKSPLRYCLTQIIEQPLRGVLYRTGPGGHQVTTSKNKTFAVSHWFDGFAQTHRFELLPPSQGKFITRVKYNSRHTCDELVERIRKTGEMPITTFGQQRDPCESFFKKVMSTFQGASLERGKTASAVNVGVTVKANMPVPEGLARPGKLQESTNSLSPKVNTLWLKTDNASLQSIDPTSLEPISAIRQPKLHPDLKGPFSAAHSRTDPVTGDWFNYNLEVGRQATYRVFSVSAKTGKTTILATLTGGPIKAAYLHSLLLTENYVVLCIFNSYFAFGGAKVLWTKNLVDAMSYDPNKKNLWLVIDRRHNRGLVGIYESDSFFAFHPVNAWEDASETAAGKADIIADIPTYPNTDTLKRMFYHNMKSTAPGSLKYLDGKGSTCRATLTRFRLPSVGNITIPTTHPPARITTPFTAASADTPELPTFNPLYSTKPTRYIYGVSDRGNSTFLDGLLKYDTKTQMAIARINHAQSPGEPMFIRNPEGKEEDDGVCLSVVLDGTKGRSYLLCLDARTFEEVGRAEMKFVVPFGFHGSHVPCS